MENKHPANVEIQKQKKERRFTKKQNGLREHSVIKFCQIVLLSYELSEQVLFRFFKFSKMLFFDKINFLCNLRWNYTDRKKASICGVDVITLKLLCCSQNEPDHPFSHMHLKLFNFSSMTTQSAPFRHGFVAHFSD